MEGRKSDAAVGFMVLAAVAVFIGATMAINRARFAADTYPLFFNVRQIEGIDKGVEVVYQGYRAGVVDQVKVTYQPKLVFNVRMAVKKEIQLRHGAEIMIRSRGIGGGRYLELTSPEEGRPVEESETLPAIPEPDLMGKASEVMGDARVMLHTLRQEGSDKDLASAVRRLNALLAHMDAMIEEDRAPLKKTLEHISVIAEKTDGLMVRNNQSIDGGMDSLKHLPKIMADLEGLVAELKRHPWRLVRKGEPPPEPAPAKQPAVK